MSFLLLCSWSSILIFVYLVRTKYKWTSAPYWLMLVFAIVGINAAFPALLCNAFIGRESEFYVASPNPIEQFMGFALGAGLGEELFKFAGGLLVIFLIGLFGYRTRPTDRFLGMVVVGLSFATVENLISYSGVEFWTMVTRNVLAVPLHASMGMIHGVAINRSYKEGSIWPLFVGYWVAAAIHVLYDTINIFLPNVDPRFYLYPMIVSLLVWGWRQWLRIPEHPDLQASLPQEAS